MYKEMLREVQVLEERFNIVKKGYDQSEVNKYIGELEEVISSYKEKDASIKNAILSAQIAADNIIMDAKSEAAEIVVSAEDEATAIKAEAIHFLDSALEAVAARKQNISSFREEYEALINKYSQFDDDHATRLISGAEELEECFREIRESIINSASENE